MNKELISNITKKMIAYFGNDVRRINHALKVYSFAKSIGELEGLSSQELNILEIASVLHDIGIKVSEEKYNSSSGKYQELEGPKVASQLLKQFDLDENIMNRILFLIGNHHTYTKIDKPDFQILIEADFIVNIYEDQLDKENIQSISDKIFKTKTGKLILESMYL